jgi:hypothetical protein
MGITVDTPLPEDKWMASAFLGHAKKPRRKKWGDLRASLTANGLRLLKVRTEMRNARCEMRGMDQIKWREIHSWLCFGVNLKIYKHTF